MKRVAVLGGGPAGSFAAERLAAAGVNTVVVEERPAWEKPCGGGLTFKAYNQYPFLIDNNTPKKLVTHTRLSASGAGTANLHLTQPLLIYARRDLNAMLLERAARAGAQIEQTRVLDMERTGGGWRIRTTGGIIDADYSIVALGVRNSLRAAGTEWTPGDTMCALGYYVPARRDHVDIHFLPNLEGYIWVFPRSEHLSVGIAGKGEPAQALRRRLERYMQEQGIPLKDALFFGHMLPSLEPGSWRRNRVAGDGWMAVGDAAGLVDPITGEGIYYAMRSGDLAGSLLASGKHAPEECALRYREVLHKEFTHDLEFGAGLVQSFYIQYPILGPISSRMIQFMRHGRQFVAVARDLFGGDQPYGGLKKRLVKAGLLSLADLVLPFRAGGSVFRAKPGLGDRRCSQ